MSPTRTASENGSGWPVGVGRVKCSIEGRAGVPPAGLVIITSPDAIARMCFMRPPLRSCEDRSAVQLLTLLCSASGPLFSQGYSLIHHLAVRDAPQVRRSDVALFLANLDAAPAVALA